MSHFNILMRYTCIITLGLTTSSVAMAEPVSKVVKQERSFLSRILPFGWGDKKIDPATMTANEVAALKEQIAKQQQMLAAQQAQMAKQQAEVAAQNLKQQQMLAQISKQLEPKTLNVQLNVSKKANATRNGQGMATVMLYGFANGMKDLPDFAGMAKDDVLIPGRNKSLTLMVDKTKTHFIAQFKLRHVKKRAQVVVPLSAVKDNNDLTIAVGQCDVSVVSGLIESPPKAVLRYTKPLATTCK